MAPIKNDSLGEAAGRKKMDPKMAAPGMELKSPTHQMGILPFNQSAKLCKNVYTKCEFQAKIIIKTEVIGSMTTCAA